MADMPSEFWAGWIVVITVTSFIALIWFVRDVYRAGDQDAGTEDEVWDETLRKGARPIEADDGRGFVIGVRRRQRCGDGFGSDSLGRRAPHLRRRLNRRVR